MSMPDGLCNFLEGLKIPQHGATLVELGYDDVDDFCNFDSEALQAFKESCLGKGIPAGHVDKLMRAILKCRPASAPPLERVAVVLPSLSVPSTVQCATSSSSSSASVVQNAAMGVGAAAAALHKQSHTAKVESLIKDQTTINPSAPRLIFGRGHSGPIKPFEEAMNAAALPLLKENPMLVSWDGPRLKTQPLIEAARVGANAQYEGWAKAKGSRAAGIAGDAGHREHRVHGSTAASCKARITPAVRATEMALLPQQILDLQSKLDTQRELLNEKRRRGSHQDLIDALQLTNDIESKQTEVKDFYRLVRICRTSTPLRARTLYDASSQFIPGRRWTRRSCC